MNYFRLLRYMIVALIFLTVYGAASLQKAGAQDAPNTAITQAKSDRRLVFWRPWPALLSKGGCKVRSVGLSRCDRPGRAQRTEQKALTLAH